MWMKSSYYGEYIKGDGSSFLFSLTNMHKLINTQKEYCIVNKSSIGPTFGGGHDLIICDQSNSKNHSFANIGNSYCNDAQYP